MIAFFHRLVNTENGLRIAALLLFLPMFFFKPMSVRQIRRGPAVWKGNPREVRRCRRPVHHGAEPGLLHRTGARSMGADLATMQVENIFPGQHFDSTLMLLHNKSA